MPEPAAKAWIDYVGAGVATPCSTRVAYVVVRRATAYSNNTESKPVAIPIKDNAHSMPAVVGQPIATDCGNQRSLLLKRSMEP